MTSTKPCSCARVTEKRFYRESHPDRPAEVAIKAALRSHSANLDSYCRLNGRCCSNGVRENWVEKGWAPPNFEIVAPLSLSVQEALLDPAPRQRPDYRSRTIQRRAVITGKPHVNKSAVEKFLRRLKYPVSFLDFGTLATALPQRSSWVKDHGSRCLRSHGSEPGVPCMICLD